MLILRHCRLSSEDLITCERALLRFVSGRAKPVDLDFNVWDYTVPEIYGYTLGMFIKLELVDCLGISSDELLDFIVDVDRGYQATFYHSFYHAADVTAVLYHMLQGMRASQYLAKPDMAALLLAGLCHDIGHPGLNNLFQINANTELVQQYGEASVLEKYSCSLAMDLVTKHALFRNISRSASSVLPEGQSATEASMRDSMIKAILATDMTFHYDMLNNLNNLVEATTSPESSSTSDAESESDPEFDGHDLDTLSNSTDSTPPTLTLTNSANAPESPKMDQPKQKTVSIALPTSTDVNPHNHRRRSLCDSNGSQDSDDSDDSNGSDSPSSSHSRSSDGHLFTPADLSVEQRQSLCNCLLHAADISNAVKPWTVCKRWSDLVVQEFFRQGDIEKAQDLPVSPNMDRDQHNQPQISLGFGDFVVQPYFEALVDLLPAASPVLKSLASNRVQWLALQKSSQHFGNDPYLTVDPLEEPSLTRRSSSPMLSDMPAGRRVSVAAGVLLLDDSRSFRTPHRRLRHSTNTEAPTGLPRRMKRSLSNRSLSTSMQNLHTHSTRSSYSSGRTAQGQDILISALKRQASLTERDMSSAAYLSHHDQLSNLAAEVAASHYAQRTTTPPPHIFPNYEPEVTKTQDQQQQQQQQRLKNSGGTFRQKRLASLQVGSPVLNNDRQDFNDGYTILKKGPPAVSDHIPSIHDEPLSTTPPGSQLYHSGQNPGSAGNRISTPAVMMSKIKYDWALSPTLPEIPVVSRFGFGPLDNIEGPGLGLEPVQIAEGHPISEPPTPFLSEQNPSLTTTTVKMMGADNIERRSAAPVLMNGDVLKVPSLGPLGGSLSAPAVPTEADFKEGDKSMSTRRDA